MTTMRFLSCVVTRRSHLTKKLPSVEPANFGAVRALRRKFFIVERSSNALSMMCSTESNI